MTTTTIDEDGYKNMDEKHHHLLLTEETELLSPFSDLSEDQLISIFGEDPPFRFEFCSVFLNYVNFIQEHKLFGTIQAAAGDFSPDPLLQQNGFSDIFNREFSNPVRVTSVGYQPLYDLRYCSLPVSSTSAVQIAAKLYVTTDKVDDMEIFTDDYDHREPAKREAIDSSVLLQLKAMEEMWIDDDKQSEQLGYNLKAACTLQTTGKKKQAEKYIDNEEKCIDNEAFQVCDAHAFINIPDKPNGGSGSYTIKGKDGSLEISYVVLKYAVYADLEIEFKRTSKETKLTGRIMAHYGKDFDYDQPADDYYVMLWEIDDDPAFVKPGKLNLMRSVLAVPAKSSLIIQAYLRDDTSGLKILWKTCELFVPRDFRSSVVTIEGTDCSLKLTVNWKLPCSPPPSSNSSVSRLVKINHGRVGANLEPKSTSVMADPDERNRWSLQEEIAKVFNTSLERTLNPGEPVSCSISTCTKEDGGDYLCSSVLHIWPELRKTHTYKGPKLAGLAVKDNIMASECKDMMERCVVCGPGFVKFKLSRKWIAKSIHKMLTGGIDTWAPKLSVKKAILYYLSPEEMHMDHLRSTSIGETLTCMLEYSRVVVLQKRIHDVDHLDIEGKSLHDPYIRKPLDLLGEKGLTTLSEGDEDIAGRKLLAVYLRTLRHALEVEKADWIFYVTDVRQRDYIETRITEGAKRALLITYDHSKSPASHVGVQGDDFETFQTISTKVVNLVNLLNVAKSRCKALLAGHAGMADEWTAKDLEHAAEALGYGAVKYADLKNSRLANYTSNLDQMLKKEGNTAVYLQFTHVRICSIIRDSSKDINKLKAEELILKNDDERELGLHLLRFTEVLGEACTILAPHILCDYIYELCEKFNGLHFSVWQVVGSSEKTSKLLLCEATEVVMRKCFDLLGITPICKI